MSSLLDTMEEIEEEQRLAAASGHADEENLEYISSEDDDDDSGQLDTAGSGESSQSGDDQESSGALSSVAKLMTLVEDDDEDGSSSHTNNTGGRRLTTEEDTEVAPRSFLQGLSFEDARHAVALRYRDNDSAASAVPPPSGPPPARRKSSITVPGAAASTNAASRQNVAAKRRSNSRASFYQQSGTSGGSPVDRDSVQSVPSARSDSESDSLFRRISSALRPNSSSSSTLRRYNSSARGIAGGGVGSNSTGTLSMKDAVDRLGSTSTNEWENVAAAAAVVAATTNTKRTGAAVQFTQGDHALVMLNILNVTSQGNADKSQFTIQPVNRHGYPAGQGHDLSKEGPHQYVLCVVKNVHFDEDERYYTVRRMDCQMELRADPGWMAPIRDPDGLSAAYAAAHWTEEYQAEHLAAQSEERQNLWLRCCGSVRMALVWPAYMVSRAVPVLREFRARLKLVTRQLIHGEPGFGCRWRCTGINFLVMCSLVYLFLDVLSLAFLPAEYDRSIAIVGFVVWIILAVELALELLIRPHDYGYLIGSEQAYNPSTARHLNAYHLVCESLALLLFVPQLFCVFSDSKCGSQIPMSLVDASIKAITSPDPVEVIGGRLVLGLTFLRVFGLVRHWKQMWLSHTFVNAQQAQEESSILRRLLLVEKAHSSPNGKGGGFLKLGKQKGSDLMDQGDLETPLLPASGKEQASEEDQQLTSAAAIGTALMLVNSHRALFLLLCIVTFFPAINTLWVANTVASEQVAHLQALNVLSNSTDDCDFLLNAVVNWLRSGASVHLDRFDWLSSSGHGLFLVWAQLLPVRCDWQRPDGIITDCRVDERSPTAGVHCRVWADTWPGVDENTNTDDVAMATPNFFADLLGLRPGGLQEHDEMALALNDFNATSSVSTFEVRGIFNESHTIALANMALVILLGTIFILVLVGLTVMRGDAGRLVLHPLKRMLRIIVRYAENPLSQSIIGKDEGSSKKQHKRPRHSSDLSEERTLAESEEDAKKDQLGSYETVQLINAISKIADLLRKCWGVAGAGIISSNLARTKQGKAVVFNPTVPGKRVYALFGFVAINDFSKQLRLLDRDVMILINDVARVVHDEVYRWALGDSGQCNKNLGAAFLMVFRIGDFTEVHDKKKKATEVVFNSQMKRPMKVRRRRGPRPSMRRGQSKRFDMGVDGMDTLQLASLPGIQGFADRALLGFLKSFAGINRDVKLQNWKKDFRLGAGVGAFSVSVMYGMDAGWAVEGAVGSEYKIDATYLSPHVNMASRMMSASKQYGVTILLSKAVEELLSKPARGKLRHLDTVYVKGSHLKQPIYTYDARHEGVDFFLFERSAEQADSDADAYTAAIWDYDRDLLSMRQHVDNDFVQMHCKGVSQYLEGNWTEAIKTLHSADNLMIQTVLDEGYIDFEANEEFADEIFNRDSRNEEVRRLQNTFGDGASKCLIQFMESRNGVPPEDWDGVRHLTSK